ncbi:carboxylesterase/lipase family protein [Mycolicibacterium moriokaense]|uniref:Carboxylic ester hydrolase n=1 Tax=Mycolicibacterium moriokaense TaxID=39691 RepID=A0A318H1X8_9MYCO|nr:carboxylesterase/lipase family protein [Mycolicibacterium moriokaense]PXW97388.1 carboxylesterase type B [Mycolicibacterium moriokaense]
MADSNIRVNTTSGTVEGFARNGVRRWRSIPYAQSTGGPLRLRAPRPPEPWRGVRYCDEFTFCAPQDRRYTLVGLNRHQPISEDCLTVNVVAPEAPRDARLPVMFFIHGGGYLLGSTATPVLYDGAALARRGCVFVSANYRLGALGCLDLSSLSTPKNPIDSNLFLRDLVLALRWVQDNVAGFGGDPDNVTIFGESAGAHAVATLLAVPPARGLFHQAISESPPSGLIQSTEAAAETARRFVTALGAGPENAARALKVAKTADLVTTLERLMTTTIADAPGDYGIGAAVDGDYLPRDPVSAMARGEAHRVPLIIGSNADEGKLFARFMNYLPTSEPVIERFLAGVEPATGQRIRNAYPGYPRPEECLRLGGDYAFGSLAWQIAESHSDHAPTYLYRYDYAPRTLNWFGLGATHGMELLPVFDLYRTALGSLLTVAGDRRSAHRVSKNIQRRWRSFGRGAVPGDDWPAYTKPARPVMVFDRHSRVEFDPTPARREAWQDFRSVR